MRKALYSLSFISSTGLSFEDKDPDLEPEEEGREDAERSPEDDIRIDNLLVDPDVKGQSTDLLRFIPHVETSLTIFDGQ